MPRLIFLCALRQTVSTLAEVSFLEPRNTRLDPCSGHSFGLQGVIGLWGRALLKPAYPSEFLVELTGRGSWWAKPTAKSGVKRGHVTVHASVRIAPCHRTRFDLATEFGRPHFDLALTR